MPGRLQKLTRAKSPVRQPRVEFFDVTCLCGRTVSGQRLTRPQAVECPDCGEGLFVLPIDAYPPVNLAAESGRRREKFWRRGDRSLGRLLPAVVRLVSGRALLLGVLAAMAASLSIAFWVDAQTRRSTRSVDSATAAAAQSAVPAQEVPPAEPLAVRSGDAPRAVRRPAPRDSAARVLSGRVQNGAVVTDSVLDLPDGTPVSIRVVPAE